MMQSAWADSIGWLRRQGKTMNPTRLVAVIVGVISMSVNAVDAQKLATNWPDYLGGPDSSHYSPLKQITPANVSKLEVAWSYPAGDGLYTFSPLVVDNVAYVAAKQGSLVALDAPSGKELWVHPFAVTGRRAGIGDDP